jgi:hypothetical protein
MNQISLPGGLSTVFQDGNALMPVLVPGAQVAQDSQLSVLTANVVVPPGLAEESGTLLQGAWAWSTPQALSLPFAQIVIPDSNTAGVTFRGAITALVGTVQTDFPVEGTVGGGGGGLAPVITPVGLGEVEQATTITANLNASNGPNTWSNLTPTAGSPSIAATLTPQGAFSWNPAGSRRGPKGNGVAYSWTATATNSAGADTRVALTLSLIPEPATLSMLALAFVGVLGFRKRS